MARRKPIKVDLAAGQHKLDGWVGLDIWEGADVVHDLNVFPWPFDDASVAELRCSHYVEHIPMQYVEHAGRSKDALFAFMDEAHRILKPGGRFEIRHPHLQSERAFQDPTHRRFIPAPTWYYMDLEWRQANMLDHYAVDCDFEVVVIQGDVDPTTSIMQRSVEVQAEWARTRWHQFADTVALLQKR